MAVAHRLRPVTALTTFIKNGFQKTLKRAQKVQELLFDLMAAYDTIWHAGVVGRLSKCLNY